MNIFAEDDVCPLFRKICRTCVRTVRKHNYKDLVSFYAKLEHDLTDAHESHETLRLNDAHKNHG